MSGRRWIRSGLLISGALLALGAVRLEAQGVESIMRAREQLELTEQQVQQLDAIRREAVAQRSTDMARIAELRSQLEAGQIRRSELMAAMEDQQEAREARTAERRASVDAVLTEEQLASVEQMRRRVDRQRPGVGRGRSGAGPGAQGFGPRGRQGLGPAARRGFGRGGAGGPGGAGGLGGPGGQDALRTPADATGIGLR